MDDTRSVWQIQLANSLQLPEWLYQRPTFSKFLGKPSASVEISASTHNNLSRNPPDLQ